jgi:hypothetical protein
MPSPVAVNSATLRGKPYKLSDDRGPYLVVTPQGFTRSMAAELGKDGIRVNGIRPSIRQAHRGACRWARRCSSALRRCRRKSGPR